MTSRNQREGWYSGKVARGTTVDGKPVKHIRGGKYMSLRGTDEMALEYSEKMRSGVVENAELLENYPLEVKGLHLLQEFVDEVAGKNKE